VTTRYKVIGVSEFWVFNVVNQSWNTFATSHAGLKGAVSFMDNIRGPQKAPKASVPHSWQKALQQVRTSNDPVLHRHLIADREEREALSSV
jgi:hypothetical protein